MNSYLTRIKNYYISNSRWIDLSFFAGGFLFDIATQSEIDASWSLIQQAIFITVLSLLLFIKTTFNGEISSRLWIEKINAFKVPITHFILGSLLSGYSLFFLKSTSFSTSAVFAFLLIGLMALNELRWLREQNSIKVLLWFLCLFCFFSICTPLALGRIGFGPFLISLLLSLVAFLGVAYASPSTWKKEIILPVLAATLSLIGLYHYKLIPPVPLSIKEIGIYHKIERVSDGYLAHHENPWWRFWHNGDQMFRAEPDDAIFLFLRIYSPVRFEDRVTLHWQLFNQEKREWITTDQIPLTIKGGRKEGFRGFAFKRNYQQGPYRVLVETSDKREIGRIHFRVNLESERNLLRLFRSKIL